MVLLRAGISLSALVRICLIYESVVHHAEVSKHRAMCVFVSLALVIKLKNVKQRGAHCVCDEFISQHMHARTKREKMRWLPALCVILLLQLNKLLE